MGELVLSEGNKQSHLLILGEHANNSCNLVGSVFRRKHNSLTRLVVGDLENGVRLYKQIIQIGVIKTLLTGGLKF